MRRFLASVLVLLGVLAGTLGWTSWLLSSTVFDSGRFSAAADVVLDSDAFEGLAVEQLTARALLAVPSLDPDLARSVAQTALQDPDAKEGLRRALVEGHASATGPSGSTTLDPAALAPLAQALGSISPELGERAAQSFALDPVQVPVPSLGWAATASQDAQAPLLGAAAALLLAAVALHPVKRSAVRAVGVWAVTLSVLGLVVLVAVPHWVAGASNPWVALGGEVVQAWAAPVTTSLVPVLLGGVLLIVLSVLLRSPERLRGRRVDESATSQGRLTRSPGSGPSRW